MTKHLTSRQRYHLFVEHQNRGTRKEKTQKEIAAEIGVHPSTVSREYRRNATPKGGYIDTKAQAQAESRKSRGEPHNKTPRLLLWRIEQWIIEQQWSPAQIVGVLAKEGTHISKQTIYNHIHKDKTGRLLANTARPAFASSGAPVSFGPVGPVGPSSGNSPPTAPGRRFCSLSPTAFSVLSVLLSFSLLSLLSG